MTSQIERCCIFVFRIWMAHLFLSAAFSEIGNPTFIATHYMPVLDHQGIFHPFFAIFVAPGIAPTVSLLVAYGHLLIGLSLLAGLLVRVSASFAIGLMLLYWLVIIDAPNIPATNPGIAGSVIYAYRLVRYVGDVLGDAHILYCVVLVYLFATRAGRIWGLDGWLAKLPLLARHRDYERWVAWIV